MSNKSFLKSEADFISWLRCRTPKYAAGLTLGIGDDAALLAVPPGRELILTTDLSIEDVHFTSAHHPPQAVGHRALARSLSDIAAMGGTPRYVLMSMALSRHVGRAWLEGFFNGFFALAREFKVALIGGDTAVVDGPTSVDVIVAGEVPRGRALLRSGAEPGDQIFVTGRLGMSALGLRLLLSRTRVRKPIQKEAVRNHLFPRPQCDLGRFLSEHRIATALMDLSDGLSIDLRRLCAASRVGARLFTERIPAPDVPDALELALHGGEDYQLLFTVPKSKAARLPELLRKTPITCVGEIRASRKVEIIDAKGDTRPLEPKGYDHFARSKIAKL